MDLRAFPFVMMLPFDGDLEGAFGRIDLGGEVERDGVYGRDSSYPIDDDGSVSIFHRDRRSS